MSELSPAAQAVWSSYEAILEYECVVTKTDMTALASALRAAADQVVPSDGSRRTKEIRADILAIADELEAQ